MPADVLEVTTKFMREPVRILVKKEELTLEGIKQFYINVEREVSTKGETLKEFNENSCPDDLEKFETLLKLVLPVCKKMLFILWCP